MTDYSDASETSLDECPKGKLSTMPMQWNQNGSIELEFPEFRHLCPVSGRPDQATLTITYKPSNKICEEKSFRDFLYDFSQIAVWHEKAVAHIADTFMRDIQPESVVIEAVFEPRGNITTTVTEKRDNYE